MRLTPRETAAVALGGVLLVVTVGWLWVVEPLQNHLGTLDRGIAFHQDRYRQLISLSQTYAALSKEIAQTETPVLNLMIVESVAGQTELLGGVVVTPSWDAVGSVLAFAPGEPSFRAAHVVGGERQKQQEHERHAYKLADAYYRFITSRSNVREIPGATRRSRSGNRCRGWSG